MPKNSTKARTTRTRLIAAARYLFLARGFAATSIEAITAHCGLTRGVFYNYFDSKSQLYHLALTAFDDTGGNRDETIADWENQLFQTLLDSALEEVNADYIPLGIFAQDHSSKNANRQTYTQILKRHMQVCLPKMNADIHRGESALLALTAMVVGAEVIAKKLDDPYLISKLRNSCQANASSLGQIEQPPPAGDYFWDSGERLEYF